MAEKKPQVSFHIRLSEDITKRMRRWCDVHGFSIAALIRLAVIEFLDREERK